MDIVEQPDGRIHCNDGEGGPYVICNEVSEAGKAVLRSLEDPGSISTAGGCTRDVLVFEDEGVGLTVIGKSGSTYIWYDGEPTIVLDSDEY